MEPLNAGDLTIEVWISSESITLAWLGKSNDRHPAKLIWPFVANVFALASERRVPVEMRFENLDHLNSSTITALIQLIQDARSRGVRLVLVYDQESKWQRLNFEALRMFAKDEFFELRGLVP